MARKKQIMDKKLKKALVGLMNVRVKDLKLALKGIQDKRLKPFKSKARKEYALEAAKLEIEALPHWDTLAKVLGVKL